MKQNLQRLYAAGDATQQVAGGNVVRFTGR